MSDKIIEYCPICKTHNTCREVGTGIMAGVSHNSVGGGNETKVASQTLDEKVLDYLKRANNLYKKMDINTRIGLGKNWLIEIAKLLQREESK